MSTPAHSREPRRASASALSATLYLMSRIALHGGCPRLALVVMEHLDLVARDVEMDPLVRETTNRLFFDWQRSIDSAYANASEREEASAIARDAIRKAMTS